MINDNVETKADKSLQCGSMQHIKWPSNKEFSSTLGKKKIIEYIKTWSLSEAWRYFIPEPFKIEKKCNDFYIYTIRWSQPTPAYPIPQATADVYFYIKICLVLSPKIPVEVMFRLENSKKIYEPGKVHFKEAWLADIINTKIEFYKTLTF